MKESSTGDREMKENIIQVQPTFSLDDNEKSIVITIFHISILAYRVFVITTSTVPACLFPTYLRILRSAMTNSKPHYVNVYLYQHTKSAVFLQIVKYNTCLRTI